MAGGWRDRARWQAALQVVRFANEELEDIVEDIAGAWGAFREVGSCEKAHGFAWKEKRWSVLEHTLLFKV